MDTGASEHATTVEAAPVGRPNGAAWAAFLAAGIGTFAMGFFVILNVAGIFAAPAVYGPSGGASGRATFAVVAWLIAWVVLHRRWRDRHVEPGRISTVTLILIALGILATFPPLWALL
jgi:hypothetical protein